MSHPLEILSYGEAIVDFLPDSAGKLVRDVEWFRKESGGAPANVAVGLARLGRKVGLMCKVGDDEFGHFLMTQLAREGVDVEAVTMTREAKTGVAFISLDAHGDRSFMFFRAPSADMTFGVEDVSPELIERASIVLCGSNLLTVPGLREATHRALDVAVKARAFVASDPNIRLHLWADPVECRREVLRMFETLDLVKLNDEELEFLAEDSVDPEAFFASHCKPRGVSTLVHTRAEKGAVVVRDGLRAAVPAPKVKVVDTTGAGDGFFAGLITGICLMHGGTGLLSAEGLRQDLEGWDVGQWRRVLSLGCFVGSRVCTDLGATRALPAHEDVPWESFGFA